MPQKNTIIEIAVLKTKMQEVNTNLSKIEKSMNKQFDLLSEKIDLLPEKYAAKWVEKVIWGTIGTVGTVLVVALLNQIIKQ